MLIALPHVEPEAHSRISDLLDGCCFEDRYLDAGDLLFREGDPSGRFYIVSSGRLRAIRGLGAGHQVVLGEIGRGEPVGEMGVLEETPRLASVIAVRDSRVMEFSSDEINKLPKATLVELMRALSARLRRSMETSTRPTLPSSLTVVPINPQVPLAEYCAHLRDSLLEAGKTSLLLSNQTIPETFRSVAESPDRGPDELMQWIEAREAEYDMVFLQADSELTGWTRRCLRFGDAIVLLGKAGTDPSKREIETAVDAMEASGACPSLYLVLIQEKSPFRGTLEWLRERKVVRHFHVRLQSESDRLRAARLLTGTDVSLALGGGGARSFAHIGILRAFEELEIPIDRIGGTSMGAMVAANYAQGMNWEEVAETVRQHFVTIGHLANYTLPALSIDTGKHYISMLESMFGDIQIEDLPLSFFCISCNLTRAVPVVHRLGSVAKWIGASVSAPGIAPPLVESGELLVDGGLLNNVPVDILRAEGAGTVVGVDVSPATDLRMPRDYFGRPGALEVIASHLPLGHSHKDHDHAAGEGVQHGFPTLADVLLRAMLLSSIHQRSEVKNLADIYINPPISDFKMLDWKRIDDLIEIGYRVGMERLKPLADARQKAGMCSGRTGR